MNWRIYYPSLAMLFICFFTCNCIVTGQKANFLSIPDSLHKKRLWSAISAGTITYGTAMTGLYQTWYKDYPSQPFEVFNDNAEWNQMDKMGHLLMAYNESKWVHGIARWTGLTSRQSAWAGFAGGQLIQTSFEVFDGFSKGWGWSWGDIGYNLLGGSLYSGQELAWKEQRITLKMSARPQQYDAFLIYPVAPASATQTTTLRQRADEIYGTGPVNLFLKNYNTLAVWASVNPHSFLNHNDGWWPRWLNVAVGLGADNLFEGRGYAWQADKNCVGSDCLTYAIDPVLYPRSRQVFFSFDVDLSKIRSKSRFLKTLLHLANIIKIPSPTLEWHSNKGWSFYPLYF